MIHMKLSIEPEKGEEFDVVSLSVMRLQCDQNSLGECSYNYGGWWKNKDGERKYITGNVWNSREHSIFDLFGKVCQDADNKIK